MYSIRFLLKALCIIVFVHWASVVLAHGVMGKIGRGGILIEAMYDTAEPMNYARVRVTPPNSKKAFQVGNTDRNGRFCFLPDSVGKWDIEVTDGMGHRLEMTVPVDERLQIAPLDGPGGPTSRVRYFERALTGISIIFGFTGMFLWWRTRRRDHNYSSLS